MAEAWLARVRHDLVKRLVWPARDRRDLGGPVVSGELVTKIIDGEGQPSTVGEVWRELLADAPGGIPDAVVHAFSAALEAAEAGARTDHLDPVLALEAAFEELARQVLNHMQGR